MPQITVYVRKEDLLKWKALEKKSETIHKMLNDELYTIEFAKGSEISEEMANPFKKRPTREKKPPQPIKSVIPSQKLSKPVKQKKIIKTPEDAKKAVEQALVRPELPRSILSGDPGDCPRHHVALNLCRDMH